MNKSAPPNNNQFEFICDACGERHSGSPSFSYKFPQIYFDVPENERAARVTVNNDLCRILPAENNIENNIENDADNSTEYAIRVMLSIPINGVNEPLLWGVWVSQSKESYEEYVSTFSQDQTGKSSFGWLEVTMPYYNISKPDEPCEYLECNVNWGNADSRPEIELWDNPHQLARDQQHGIDWDTAIKIAKMTMHP